MDKYQELREMIINEIVYYKQMYYQKDSEKNKLIAELSGLTDYSLVAELSYWVGERARENAENPYGY